MASIEWSARQYWKYLVLSFGLSWSIWIPVLLLSRRYEGFENVLIRGAFGPSLAAILLSRSGVRISGRAMISQRFASRRCYSLVGLSWLGHQILWDETPVSFFTVGLFCCRQHFLRGLYVLRIPTTAVFGRRCDHWLHLGQPCGKLLACC